MELNKIRLGSTDSKSTPGTSSSVGVSLTSDRHQLVMPDIYGLTSGFEQYMLERGMSSKVRVTSEVNVIASNVLCNDITEIVKDEGSKDVILLNGTTAGTYAAYAADSMSYHKDTAETATATSSTQACANAIRNTILSNDDNGFVYHCGRDIFNNHILRNTTFKTVNEKKAAEPVTAGNTIDEANTIADWMYSVDSRHVDEKIMLPISANSPNNGKDVSLHLYTSSDILSYEECIGEKLITRYDGWCGFYNKGKMLTYSDFKAGTPMKINKVINSSSSGDFIDMYPSRDLFSFVPKYNRFRKRSENNWNCCVTFPYSSLTTGASISDEAGFLHPSINALKAFAYNENTLDSTGNRQTVVYSLTKHGLRAGDTVNLYMSDKSEASTTLVYQSVEVTDIVDEYIFTTFNDGRPFSDKWVDIDRARKNGPDDEYYIDSDYVLHYGQDTYTFERTKQSYQGTDGTLYSVLDGRWVNLSDSAYTMYYKKCVGGVECSYYVRLFARVPNLKYMDGIPDDETDLMQYSSNEYEFTSIQSKLGFSKNIYSDQIGQVVFTDDIDLRHIRDNLGRPVTSLYLLFIKNNRGYKEWYGYNYTPVDRGSENVEFSHCFGAITCAFDLIKDSIYRNESVNLKTINNISFTKYPGLSSRINNRGGCEVDYFRDKLFYGDLVCFDNTQYTETSLQWANHRFSTGQRESKLSSENVLFKDFSYDEIKRDDFDSDSQSFTIETTLSKQLFGDDSNARKEGYYYQPLYEIPIDEFGSLQYISPDTLSMTSASTNPDTHVITIFTSGDHYLSSGEEACVKDYSSSTKSFKYVYLKVDESLSRNKFSCKAYHDKELKDEYPEFEMNFGPSRNDREKRLGYTLFKLDNLDAPSYAMVMKDGSCRVMWRPVLKNGIGTQSTEEYPFTNGAIYVNRRVDIFVRRQDPDGTNGLWSGIDEYGSIDDITQENTYYKENEMLC